MVDTKLGCRDTIFASKDGEGSGHVPVAFPSAGLTPVVSPLRVVEATTYRALLTGVLLVSRTRSHASFSGFILKVLPCPAVFPLAYLLSGMFVELSIFPGAPGRILRIADDKLAYSFGLTEIDSLPGSMMYQVANLVVGLAHYPSSSLDILPVLPASLLTSAYLLGQNSKGLVSPLFDCAYLPARNHNGFTVLSTNSNWVYLSHVHTGLETVFFHRFFRELHGIGQDVASLSPDDFAGMNGAYTPMRHETRVETHSCRESEDHGPRSGFRDGGFLEGNGEKLLLAVRIPGLLVAVTPETGDGLPAGNELVREGLDSLTVEIEPALDPFLKLVLANPPTMRGLVPCPCDIEDIVPALRRFLLVVGKKLFLFGSKTQYVVAGLYHLLDPGPLGFYVLFDGTCRNTACSSAKIGIAPYLATFFDLRESSCHSTAGNSLDLANQFGRAEPRQCRQGKVYMVRHNLKGNHRTAKLIRLGDNCLFYSFTHGFIVQYLVAVLWTPDEMIVDKKLGVPGGSILCILRVFHTNFISIHKQNIKGIRLSSPPQRRGFPGEKGGKNYIRNLFSSPR